MLILNNISKIITKSTAEECKAFLTTKNLLKTSEDYVYYVITRKGETQASFSSIDLLEDYIKNHSNIFQVIYRKKSMINGKIRYGSFHVYYI